MEVVASGAFWDARTAPINERSASSTAAVALADGTVLATCRLGTDREGADGTSTHVVRSTAHGALQEVGAANAPSGAPVPRDGGCAARAFPSPF